MYMYTTVVNTYLGEYCVYIRFKELFTARRLKYVYEILLCKTKCALNFMMQVYID